MKLTVSSNTTLLKSIPTRAARSPMSYRWLSLFTLLMSGCCMSKADELAAVAKDWSLTIRASQVIPVYPLTEDLEPGDVFLVQTPLQEQAEAYEANGFLPLDQHLVRLHPKAFADFYDKSFGIKTNTDTPHHWQFPPVPVQVPAQLPAAGGGATKGKAVLVGGTQEGDTKKDGDAKEAAIPPYPPTDWTNAPLAGFPTYNFSVKKGGGLNLAVPVQGVPIALGATASSSATGSITIADAHTYGLDIATLSKKLKNWADDNKELLANYLPVILPGEKKLTYFYVRVVTRVYLAGRVNVTLNSDKSFAANLSGGDPKEVVLPGTESRTPPSRTSETNPDKPAEKPEERPQDKVKSTINGLSKGPDAILPGGTLKVAMTSSHSLSMIETFRRPLVIGYLAYDAPIMADLSIGPYEPTNARLLQQKQLTPLKLRPPGEFGRDENSERIDKWVATEANKASLYRWLEAKGMDKGMLSPVLNLKEHTDLRKEIVKDFKIPN